VLGSRLHLSCLDNAEFLLDGFRVQERRRTVLSTAFSSEFLLDGLMCRNDEERFSRLLSLPSFRSMVLCAGTTNNGSLDCFLFRVSTRRSRVQERRKTVLSTAFPSEFLLDGPVQERRRTVLSDLGLTRMARWVLLLLPTFYSCGPYSEVEHAVSSVVDLPWKSNTLIEAPGGGIARLFA
jgi:hypothetical protein